MKCSEYIVQRVVQEYMSAKQTFLRQRDKDDNCPWYIIIQLKLATLQYLQMHSWKTLFKENLNSTCDSFKANEAKRFHYCSVD